MVVVVVSSVELSSDEEPLEPKGDGLGVGVGDISADGILAEDPLIDADEPGTEAAPEGALTSGGTLVPGELAEVWAKLGPDSDIAVNNTEVPASNIKRDLIADTPWIN